MPQPPCRDGRVLAARPRARVGMADTKPLPHGTIPLGHWASGAGHWGSPKWRKACVWKAPRAVPAGRGHLGLVALAPLQVPLVWLQLSLSELGYF